MKLDKSSDDFLRTSSKRHRNGKWKWKMVTGTENGRNTRGPADNLSIDAHPGAGSSFRPTASQCQDTKSIFIDILLQSIILPPPHARLLAPGHAPFAEHPLGTVFRAFRVHLAGINTFALLWSSGVARSWSRGPA